MEFEFRNWNRNLIFNPPSLAQAVRAASSSLDAEKVLVISSPRQFAAVESELENIPELLSTRFTNVHQHVPDHVRVSLLETIEQQKPDTLLSIGGGSATGAAKIAARDTGLPIIAVPTTFAGSELTPIWGLTVDNNKSTGISDAVVPRVVIYVPELLASLDRYTTLTSAFNAMAHCVEGFWTKKTNPISQLLATASITSIRVGLTKGDNTELLYGAMLAGEVFSVTGGGLHHRICHLLGGAFNLPHAPLHTVILPHVLRLNQGPLSNNDVFQRAFHSSQNPAGDLWDQVAELEGPTSLAQIGLRQDQEVAAIEVLNSGLPFTNPVPVTREIIKEIIHEAFIGQRP